MLLLNENVGEILHDLELGKKFSETTAKDRSGKEKNDKLCFIKIKITVLKKNTTQEMKIQVRNWEKIFANHTLNKELVSTVYKVFLQLKNKNSMKKKLPKNFE